jgi:N-acylneuraminate cytidylyltransferase
LIPARGGSKGLPRKNVRPLAGKPLIAYSIETALSSKLIDRVIVSTDDPEIADVARTHGAEVPFLRPAELARDDSPEWLTWRHAIRTLQEEPGTRVATLVCVSPTSPLRAVEDVDACIRELQGTDADIVITVRSAERNPYFNMVVLDGNGYAGLVIPPRDNVYRRQDAPTIYDMTTVAYAARPDYVLRASSTFQGKVRAVTVPSERAVDIDTELDFRFAEFLLSQSKRSVHGGAGR